MRKLAFTLLAALPLCLSAQFRISHGNVMVGDPLSDTPTDTLSRIVLHGRADRGSAARLSFGDGCLPRLSNVSIGELGCYDSDLMEIHGRRGLYFTFAQADTLGYFDIKRSKDLTLRCGLRADGLLVSADESTMKAGEYLDLGETSLAGLAPVSYTAAPRVAAPITGSSSAKDADDAKDFGEFYGNVDSTPRYGLRAEDVEQVMPSLVVADPEGRKYIDYAGMMAVMVGSLNAMQARIAELEAEVESLRCGEAMPQKAPAKGSEPAETSATGSRLYQNTPNPFSESTRIGFFIEEAVSDATLTVYNDNGKPVMTRKVTEQGEGWLQISPGTLSPGIYVYTLTAEGRLIDSKKMVVTK